MAKPSKKDQKISDSEFHAGLQNLSQFLYIIRDMASTEDEKNLKNAKILQTNVFSRDIMSVVRHALKMFDPKKHSI
jgi:hypothetical protein